MFIENLSAVSDAVLLKQFEYCKEYDQLFLERWEQDQSHDWFLYENRVYAEMNRRGLKK